MAFEGSERQNSLRSADAAKTVSTLGCHQRGGRSDSFWRDGLLQAHSSGGRSRVVQRYAGRNRRTQFRLGALEFPWTLWSARHRTSRNQIRGLARPQTRQGTPHATPEQDQKNINRNLGVGAGVTSTEV